MDVVLRCLGLVLTTLVAFTVGSATTATTSTSQETQCCKINSDCPQTRRCLDEKCSDPCPGKCGKNTICEVVHHQPFCLCKDGYTGCPYTGCHPSGNIISVTQQYSVQTLKYEQTCLYIPRI
ncbi:uncharacterized protein LOC124367275 [Homalodisca vitripennis]|uniref:uncharacterized protein LOC124367275 n=1 Tax=Homalodisca vitripennis TaxID=197043 RepID=UPI001EEA700D|nr:uncharacterized protein LOC124367275 [Homalodisca vitripennis]